MHCSLDFHSCFACHNFGNIYIDNLITFTIMLALNLWHCVSQTSGFVVFSYTHCHFLLKLLELVYSIKILKSDSSLKESKKIFCFICDISVIALVSIFPMLLLIHLTFLHFFLHPHMHEIYLQLYCMKCFPRNPQKEMVN